MSIIQCQSCGDVISDPLLPCPSCGNVYSQSLQSPAQPPSSNYYSDVSYFSVVTVMSRSFSMFFKHPFVFLGLILLPQLPGLAIKGLMRDSAASNRVSFVVSLIFGIASQGAIACGVLEVLRGNAARFADSMSRGITRIIPMVFAVLSFFSFNFLAFFAGFLLTRFFRGPLAINLIFILAVLTIFAFLCRWCVFIPACVIERLGPIESLYRSSELTSGCRFKIGGTYLLCFGISYFVDRLVGTSSVIQQLISAVPIGFAHVITAIIYYELREFKEGATVDSIANAFANEFHQFHKRN